MASLLLLSVPAIAAPEKEEAPPEEEQEYTTVVTGKLGPEPLYSADRSISVVTGEELKERRPRTTPEALWEAPGVYVQQTNHAGGSPIVRGMIGPQVLLVVDGVRLSNSTYRTGPMQYLNLLDPYATARLEVLRGAGSLLYGSDAMGGVIQAVPVGPRDVRGADGFDGGATVAMRRASADSGHTLHGHGDMGYGGLSVLGGVSYSHLGNLLGGGDVGEQVYSGYRAWYLWSADRRTLIAYVVNSSRHVEKVVHLGGTFQRFPEPTACGVTLQRFPSERLVCRVYDLNGKDLVHQAAISGGHTLRLGVSKKDFLVLVAPL